MSTSSRAQKSTNVRTTPPPWLRLGFQALSPLFPDTAAAFAADAFFTPTRGRVKGATLPDEAQRFTLPTAHGRIEGWWWAPTGVPAGGAGGRPVYLVHGWNGVGAQLAPWVEPLRAAGHRVVTFDAPGHGASEGARASLLTFADTLGAVAALHGPAAGIVAHSLGASAAALAVSRGDLRADRVVLVAPAEDPARYLLRFAAWLGADVALQQRIRATVEARSRRSLDDLYVPELVASWPARTELLVVHDQGDRDTPFAGGARIAEARPGAALWATRGLGHRRVLGDGPVVAGGAAWVIGGPLPALPAWRCACGATPLVDGERCERCAFEHDLFAPGGRPPPAPTGSAPTGSAPTDG